MTTRATPPRNAPNTLAWTRPLDAAPRGQTAAVGVDGAAARAGAGWQAMSTGPMHGKLGGGPCRTSACDVCGSPKPVERSPSYELGRARGWVTGRTVPTERDAEWWAEQPGVDGDDDYAFDDFGDGMLDGAEQHATRGIPPHVEPPSPEALAAAGEP